MSTKSNKSNKSALSAARAEKKEAYEIYQKIRHEMEARQDEIIDNMVNVLRNSEKPMTARQLANRDGVGMSSYEIAGNLCFGDVKWRLRGKNEKVKVTRGKTVTRVYAEILEDGTVDKSHIVTRKESLPNSYEIVKEY